MLKKKDACMGGAYSLRIVTIAMYIQASWWPETLFGARGRLCTYDGYAV